MKKFALGFCLAIIVALFPSASTAQTKLQKLFTDLKHQKIFTALNKKQQTTNNKPQQQTTNTNSQLPDKNTNNVPPSTSAPNSLKPGDIALNAVYIDADDLYPFNGGAAIVQKGDATALIDKTGKFVVPYNKYKFDMSGPSLYYSRLEGGIFLLQGDSAAVNAKGVLITKGFHDLTWGYSSPVGHYISATDMKHHAFYLDAKGDKYILNNSNVVIENGISDGTVMEESKNKYGYKNLKDQWIVPPIYDAGQPFSDGLACVGKLNQFGEMKYGFVDKKGKAVIPFIFSNRPADFHAGITKVVPKDRTAFSKAYINKQGKIIRKLQSDDTSFYYIENGYYKGGKQNSSDSYLMDSTGKIVPVDEFLKSYGVVPNASTWNLTLNYSNYTGTYSLDFDNGKVFFMRSTNNNGNLMGYINIKTKKVMEGPFDVPLTGDLMYDWKSGLAYAESYSSKIHDNDHLIKGYINEDGIFVIVKKAASVF